LPLNAEGKYQVVKALLIYPADINPVRTNVPTGLEKGTGKYPPLGLLSVAAFAREHTDWEIEVIDAKTEELSYDALEERIRNAAPDIVAISTMTFNLLDVIESARRVKNVNADILVCVGGPHPSIFPELTAKIKEIDYAILGEGEIVFGEFLRHVQEKRDLSDLKGIAFGQNGKIICTDRSDFIRDLDELPFPARELTDIQSYFSPLSHRRPITTMMSSRGCPHRCIFCDRPHLGKKFRMRSPKNVVDEMEHCRGLGIEDIFFYDDTFTLNKKRVAEICQEIKRRKLEIGWDIRTRVDAVDEQMLRDLKESGCARIHYGIESGSPEILKELRKDIDLEQAIKVFQYTRKMGIKTLAYFMIGNPKEEKRHIEQTARFARKLNPDYLHIGILTPFPATELYAKGLDSGLLPRDYWKAYAENPTSEFVPMYWNENFDDEELVKILRDFYRRFYIRPRYLMRSVLGIKSLGDLKTKISTGLSITRL
jgi:radical SAM superfamily enzyme YgiQ (UPF0313 family)